MDISNRTIWQQAGGDRDRNYADICLKWGVILNGPGGDAPWPDCRETLSMDGIHQRKLTDLRRFAEEMKEGDIIALRLGTSEIVGLGEIVGPYEWDPMFGDIDGWDLKHVRRVRWLWQGYPDSKQFPTYSLKLGDTTQRLTSAEVLAWIESFEPAVGSTSKLIELPADGSRTVELHEISDALFDKGVSSQAIHGMLAEIGELQRIAHWYRRSQTPSEHETVAYLAVPMLRALGWTPQRMAIEWNWVDVALFDRLPREDANLTAVVEAKPLDRSCLSAASQAEGYARDKGQCLRLIVTDGIRYGAYVRNSTSFELKAYLNLLSLRNSYPILGCDGATEALHIMSPDWIPQASK